MDEITERNLLAYRLRSEIQHEIQKIDRRLAKLIAEQQALMSQPIPGLIPADDFRQWTYGNETFVLNETEAKRAALLWKTRTQSKTDEGIPSGVRRKDLIDGTGYDKPSKLFQSRGGKRFYSMFVRNKHSRYWIEIPHS